jgi:hypothetical protein
MGCASGVKRWLGSQDGMSFGQPIVALSAAANALLAQTLAASSCRNDRRCSLMDMTGSRSCGLKHT